MRFLPRINFCWRINRVTIIILLSRLIPGSAPALYFSFFLHPTIFKGLLHLPKFAIANIVQVLVQVIRKVDRSKIHIVQS